MAATTMRTVLLVCGLLALAGGRRFDALNLASTTSPHSQGISAAGRPTTALLLWPKHKLLAASLQQHVRLPHQNSTRSPYSQGISASGYSIPAPCNCGPNADCLYPHGNETKQCACKDGYIGSPPRCKPGNELWNLCFTDNPCGPWSECEVVNGTRRCPYCAVFYEGSPPHCHPPDKCRDEGAVCGPNAQCEPLYFPPCSCERGFVGTPPNCTAGPDLLATCNPYPCGPHAECHMQDGRPACECARGHVGTPPHCQPGAEMWRVCFKDAPCGKHAGCAMVDRRAVCSPCDKGYSGEPPHCYSTNYTIHSLPEVRSPVVH